MFMRHCSLTYVTVFENCDLGGNCFEKKKIGYCFWKFLKISKILKIRDSRFVALLILRHFI